MKELYLELFWILRDLFRELYLFFDGCYKDLLYQEGRGTTTTTSIDVREDDQ